MKIYLFLVTPPVKRRKTIAAFFFSGVKNAASYIHVCDLLRNVCEALKSSKFVWKLGNQN